MNCDDYRRVVHEYARGHLSPEKAAEVEHHHRECANCIEFNTICTELLCNDFVRFLDDYAEESLPPERRAMFDRHMTVCPDCIAYLDFYRRTIAMGEAAGADTGDAAAPIPEALIRAILDASKDT
ncbi:MAG: anti-sigma factor RsiW [Chlamydiales bacterium]|jgi:anti-sigma factor RsiW